MARGDVTPCLRGSGYPVCDVDTKPVSRNNEHSQVDLALKELVSKMEEVYCY